MPGGNRRLPRTLRNSVPIMQGYNNEVSGSRYAPLGAAIPTLPALEQATGPKHFPFPNTPIDGDVFFEFMMFVFTCAAVALQLLHLYRTVWWLPHSYTNQTINYYLIDVYLVAFIMILLSRRLVCITGCRIIERFLPLKMVDISLTCYRVILFIIMISLLLLCEYHIPQGFSLQNIVSLWYPFGTAFIMLQGRISSFFELFMWNFSSSPPLHACPTNAAEVREEVENLRTNFNNRLSQVLVNSVLIAYYAAFIPCLFAQNHLYYDKYWATQHVLFTFLTSFAAYSVHILSLRYCDILHRSALHLGNWDKLETRSMLLVNNNWNEETLWPYGALVKHGRDLYRAQGECNASEPGNTNFSRFYIVFKNPSFSLSILLTLHMAMVLFQLVLLIRSVIWYNILSIVVLLCFNYYFLFKIGRDYLVSSKMYEEERAMHNKINVH